MKYLTLIFFLSFLITSCSNSNKNSNKNIKKDTVFIEKEYNKDDKYAVFIAPSKNSEYYDHISDYSFGKFDHQSYKESLDYLKRKKLELSKVSINDFPKNWILLHQYKGKHYVYSPNDYYFHYKIKITNNSYIDFSGEGPSANKILDFKKIDQNTVQFNLAGIGSNGRKVLIHLIDKNAGIAVFEDVSLDREKYYYLMVDAHKIRNFPLIVNYSINNKYHEISFDKIDFQSLLKGK